MRIIRRRLGASTLIAMVVAAALAGLLAGAALHPVQTTAATTYTRSWSCQGRDFNPIADDQSFGWFHGMRTGDGYFQCDADLPHKAVVTRVRFSVHDSVLNGQVSECRLVRVSLGIDRAVGQEETLGDSVDTGVPFNPGNFVTSDTSISFATIDRTNFAYHAICWVDYKTDGLGIWGVSVTFKITAANG